MTIYLIRHGETSLNAARILQPVDTPLSATGLAQAQSLGMRLKALPIGAVLCSDLLRAQQTASGLLQWRPQLSYLESPLLQERNLGDLRGQPYSALNAPLSHYEPAPPGGESLLEFNARVAQAFEEIITLAEQFGNLAVVSHGLVLRQLLEAHFQLPAGQKTVSGLDNTSISFAHGKAPYSVSLVNCTEHLKPHEQASVKQNFGG
jgi:broad specificity phosphatase PhoE